MSIESPSHEAKSHPEAKEVELFAIPLGQLPAQRSTNLMTYLRSSTRYVQPTVQYERLHRYGHVDHRFPFSIVFSHSTIREKR